MCRFGCYYFGNPLKDLRFTLVLVRAVGTLLMQKGNGALPALLHIGAAFRRITCRTPENFCSFFVEFKISKDIRGEFPRQACSEDRKSTRLNSSHVSISYAVFCLKKKNIRTAVTQCIVHL